jgi:hypothetical protein
MRFNQGKIEWSLVDFKSLEPLVKVLTFGKEKYERDNWKLGGENTSQQSLMDSLLRHATALADGQQIDPESGLHHIGHIMCNCLFYSYHHIMKNQKVTD